MLHYREWFKERTVQMIMSPNAMSVAQLSRGAGVSEQTLYNWRVRFRHQRDAVYKTAQQGSPQRWSGKTRNWNPVEEVWLNPPAGHQAAKELDLKAA